MSLCQVLVILIEFQTVHQQKDYDSQKVQMMIIFLATKHFRIKVCALFETLFEAHLIDYSIV